MTPEIFRQHLVSFCASWSGRALNTDLQQWLNAEHGPTSASFQQLRQDVQAGVQAGWLCDREAGGLRFGRIFKPTDELQGFSVDVVDMTSLAGPHHTHPNGEIDLILPVDPDAQFDGHGAGWLVYPPGSAHAPTVTQGRAFVLYLLPQGRIDFTR